MYEQGFPRLSAVVYAVASGQMTLQELRAAMRPLSPESLQVAATVLGCRAANCPAPSERLRKGRALCLKAAAKGRPLS